MNSQDKSPPTKEDRADQSGRRKWLQRTAGVAATGALGYPLLQYASGCSKHETPKKSVSDTNENVVVCKQDELGPNQMRVVQKQGRPIIVYRIGEAPPVARSAKCTHMGCTVRFRPSKGDLNCACHNAIYDAKTGAVVSGPATKPLASYPVKIQDGNIVIQM